MFVVAGDNTKEIDEFVRSEKEKSMAVAFVGAGLSKRLAGKVKIICNLMSGATNPDEVAALQDLPGVEVRNHSKLHAKVYITEDTLIVGSANLSTNGIGLEDEAAGWLEASIVTHHQKLIVEAQEWFISLWGSDDETEKITSAMLAEARKLFEAARKRRPFVGMGLEVLRDRDYHCVIYKNDQCSPGAHQLMNQNVGADWQKRGYGIYEEWGADLPIGFLIDHHLKDGKLRYAGIWRHDGYRLESEETDVQIAMKIKNPCFAAKELTRALSDNLDKLWPDHDHQSEGGVVIPINDVLAVLEEG